MKTLRFIVITLTALLLAGCKLSLTNEIAVVDLNIIAKTLGRDELIVKNVKSANDNLNKQLEKIAADLREQLEVEKSNLGEKPSKEKELVFTQLVQKANNQLNQTKQVALQKSQQLQNSLVAEFRKEVSIISRQIALDNGYQAVFAINDSLLWTDNSVDITSEVIREMRLNDDKKIDTDNNKVTKEN